jgi:hypothetical protein
MKAELGDETEKFTLQVFDFALTIRRNASRRLVPDHNLATATTPLYLGTKLYLAVSWEEFVFRRGQFSKSK